MTKRISINILCIMLLCVASVFVFSACGSKNYTYTDFQTAFSEYVSSNTLSDTNVNAIFDTSGSVKVNYANTKLLAEIEANSVEDYKLMYTRLRSDASSNQAVFEPALKASLLMIQKYLSVEPVNPIPSEKVNVLMEKLAVLDSKTDSFTFNLVKFQTRGDDFYKDNGIDKAFLKRTLSSYYDLLVASCDLSKAFSEVANTYFWNELGDNKGRVAPGKIERYYLTQLTSLVDTYVRYDLATFYSQSVVISGSEYFTSKDPARLINQMMSMYESSKSSLSDFEGRYNSGAMNADEWKIVNSYKEAKNYDETYSKALNIASKSLSRIDDKTINLDEEFKANNATQMHKEVVSHFVQNEFHNKLNTMISLINNVQIWANTD